MKIATYNVNGIRARLPRLLEWLEREQPDAVCLQELKCADEALPIADIEAAGYGAVWHGQKGFNGVAILARGAAPALRHVGLPGYPDDSHSRYIEAEAGGIVIASLYLPNGNPIGTEKFAYKLNWMERLRAHAAELLREEKPTILAGDWNVIPEDRDVFSAKAVARDALIQPETRAAYRDDPLPGLDRRPARAPPERSETMDLLGLYDGRVAARPRLPHRPSAVQPASGRPAARGGDRPLAARGRESERPYPGVGGAGLSRTGQGLPDCLSPSPLRPTRNGSARHPPLCAAPSLPRQAAEEK